jgi:hypothetical protein
MMSWDGLGAIAAALMAFIALNASSTMPSPRP